MPGENKPTTRYVSAKYAPDAPAGPGPKPIIVTDENGVEWYLTSDSQEGDWLRYLEAGGTIDPADEP